MNLLKKIIYKRIYYENYPFDSGNAAYYISSNRASIIKMCGYTFKRIDEKITCIDMERHRNAKQTFVKKTLYKKL